VAGLQIFLSKDFSILGLAYEFLSQTPRFIFSNHKQLTEALDFWFEDLFPQDLLKP
jgi:hypothetical protein